MALALVAALAGLAAAGAMLLHPISDGPPAVPAGDVALVNGEPILMSDFINELEAIEGKPFAETTPAARAKVLHDMVDEELMVQRALALDLPEQDTTVRSALVDGFNAQVTAASQARRPTDDELQAYYAAHRAKYATEGSMTLTDLVLHVGGFENAAQTFDQALADAAQAAYELRSGAPMSYVTQHFGMAPSSGLSGEEPDFAAKVYLGPKLFAVAQALSDGQISEPIAVADGVHVLVMQHRQAPIFTDFNAVRNNVYIDYNLAERTRVQKENLTFLRSKAQIVLASGRHE